MKSVHLLIIDPQFDFCDDSGSLFVPGADEDMARLASFIDKHRDKITKIHVTLDSHNEVDIAHPVFWTNENGKNPDPFTIISLDDIKNGKWKAARPTFQKRAKDYVKQLEANKRYPLCVWPPHCLIGSTGAKVVDDLRYALQEWANTSFRTVNWVAKGTNPFTEHYSAVVADVPDPQDPTTHINTSLISTLNEADIILLAGEASSHCLANTVRDIAKEFDNKEYIEKLVLLTDASSPVPGFANLTEDFIKDMSAKGMKTTITSEWTL